MGNEIVKVHEVVNTISASVNDGSYNLLAGGTIGGPLQLNSTLTVGVDDTGYDVKFFGDAASKFMHWDASEDELKLPDSTKLIFGTGGDLKIYHESGNNWITCPVGGNLMIQSNGLALRSMAQDNYINCTSDGSVDLYYNNSKKFETTNTGATITGKLICTGDMDVSGTTTTFNSTTVLVEDPILTLGGTDPAGSDDNKDRGIEFHYHDGSSARVGFFGYDDSASVFTFLTAATNSSEVFSGTLGAVKTGALTVEGGRLTLTSGTGEAIKVTNSDIVNFDFSTVRADQFRASSNSNQLEFRGGTNQTSFLNSDGGTELLALTNAGQLLNSDGTAAAPSISFSSDTNTGFYYAGTDSIGISTNGTYRAKFTSSGLFETWAGIQLKGGVIRTTDGDASAPSYSFQSDTDTGFYYSSNTLYASFAG